LVFFLPRLTEEIIFSVVVFPAAAFLETAFLPMVFGAGFRSVMAEIDAGRPRLFTDLPACAGIGTAFEGRPRRLESRDSGRIEFFWDDPFLFASLAAGASTETAFRGRPRGLEGVAAFFSAFMKLLIGFQKRVLQKFFTSEVAPSGKPDWVI